MLKLVLPLLLIAVAVWLVNIYFPPGCTIDQCLLNKLFTKKTSIPRELEPPAASSAGLLESTPSAQADLPVPPTPSPSPVIQIKLPDGSAALPAQKYVYQTYNN